MCILVSRPITPRQQLINRNTFRLSILPHNSPNTGMQIMQHLSTPTTGIKNNSILAVFSNSNNM